MPCYLIRLKDGARGFLCGDFGPHCTAADCGDVSEYLCDYPVGDERTCDLPFCASHAYEVAPDIHYCPGHLALWLEFRKSGGMERELANVLPFKAKM